MQKAIQPAQPIALMQAARQEIVLRKFTVVVREPPTPAAKGTNLGLLQVLREQNIEGEYVGFRHPVRQPEWNLTPTQPTEWVLVRRNDDLSWERGLEVPERIQRNLIKAHRSGIFDDFYIAHELPSVQGRTPESPIPWKELESGRVRRALERIDRSAQRDEKMMRRALGGFATLSKWGAVFIGVSVSLIVLLAIIYLFFELIMTAAFTVAVGLLVLFVFSLLGSSQAATSGSFDPVVYGVIHEKDAQGRPITLWYSLGQWDIQ